MSCEHTSFSAVPWDFFKPIDPNGEVYKCNGCGAIGQFQIAEPYLFIKLKYGRYEGKRHVLSWDESKRLSRDNPGKVILFENFWGGSWGNDTKS